MPITEAEWKQRYYDLVEKMKSEGYNVTYKGKLVGGDEAIDCNDIPTVNK